MIHAYAIIGVALTIVFSAISLAEADSINQGVFSIDSKPYGLTYAGWTIKWWHWFSGIPQAVNPARIRPVSIRPASERTSMVPSRDHWRFSRANMHHTRREGCSVPNSCFRVLICGIS